MDQPNSVGSWSASCQCTRQEVAVSQSLSEHVTQSRIVVFWRSRKKSEALRVVADLAYRIDNGAGQRRVGLLRRAGKQTSISRISLSCGGPTPTGRALGGRQPRLRLLQKEGPGRVQQQICSGVLQDVDFRFCVFQFVWTEPDNACFTAGDREAK